MEPQNKQIGACLKSKMKAILLEQRTPEDVLDFFIETGNEERVQAHTTFVQCMSKIPLIEKSFHHERKTGKAGCPPITTGL